MSARRCEPPARRRTAARPRSSRSWSPRSWVIRSAATRCRCRYVSSRRTRRTCEAGQRIIGACQSEARRGTDKGLFPTWVGMMKEVSVIARPHLEKIINRAVSLGPARVAVTYPCSASSIEATVTAQRMGLIEPILIGPRRRIESIAEEQQFDVSRMVFVETGDDPVSAAQGSIALCQEDKASLIMKGSLHTDELLAVVVGKDSGLRTARRMSHAFVFDLPDYSGPLLMADCVVNINPSLIDKRDITQNAIDLAHILGIARPDRGL